ncbi:MAG: MoxR family ATPase [Planctomycetota bacterium]|nr:MoxR family ATPase [Planctomycetota bacterium]
MKVARLITNIERAILGKSEAIKQVVAALLARGHVLIEDVPGVGKTTLARALALSISCEFRRIQFTPDLLPSDLVGVSVYDQRAGEFVFHKGPIFSNIVLADEINRTTPRTQSALLEAMNDFQVSVDGRTYKLDEPFMVLATENPIEYAGTYPLPEAQLDRFLARIAIGYPDRDSEMRMLEEHRAGTPLEKMLEPVLDGGEVIRIQEAVREVKVDPALAGYILEIANKTRGSKALALGVSPRGCLMLYRAAQAMAFVEGRDFCLPDDIKRMAVPVLAHRVVEKGALSGGRRDARGIVQEIVDEVPVPL